MSDDAITKARTELKQVEAAWKASIKVFAEARVEMDRLAALHTEAQRNLNLALAAEIKRLANIKERDSQS